MYIYLSRKIKISVITVVTLIIFIFSYFGTEAVCMVCASALHELGHVVFAKLCGAKISSVTIGIGGADMKIYGATSYLGDALIALGGIIANILFFLLFYKSTFAVYNIIYAIINAMPAVELDGGRALRSLLLSRFGNKADPFCRFFSMATLFVIWQVSVYLLFKTGANFSLFLFCICIFSTMTDDSTR